MRVMRALPRIALTGRLVITVIAVLATSACVRIGFEDSSSVEDTTVLTDTTSDVTPFSCPEECPNPALPCLISTCIEGACHEVSLPNGFGCTVSPCVKGKCLDGLCEPSQKKDCDDGNPCTIDDCTDAGCTHLLDSCDDDDPCTVDVCKSDGCLHIADPSCACKTSSDCPEPAWKACTKVSCNDAFQCEYTDAEDLPCDDADPCTEGDVCNEGQCAGEPLCEDLSVCGGSPCLDGECLPPDSLCDDGDPCTVDSCQKTGCHHKPELCEDDDNCTDDSCDSLLGCIHEDFGQACDDGNDCTIDTCTPSDGCIFTPGANCACKKATDCLKPNAFSCMDAECFEGSCFFWPKPFMTECSGPCQTPGQCLGAEKCEVAGPLCDDGDACTKDKCEPDNYCTHDEVCDDDNPCTIDGCNEGLCKYTPIVCEDDKPCTTSLCNEDGLCVHIPGNCSFCLKTSDCKNDCALMKCNLATKQCEVTDTMKTCDDKKSCTKDFCDPTTGDCLYKALPAGESCPNSNGACDGLGNCIDN